MKKILKTIFVFILSMFLLLNPIFNIYAQETETNQIKYVEIGRAHVWTPVTWPSRMPSSAWKKKIS